MEPGLRGTKRLASAGRALDKVQTGLKLVDTVLKLGESAGLPLIPAVCSAARGVLQVVQESRTVISDALSAAQRTIDVLELLQLMAENVDRMDMKSRASVEDRMRELQRLLDDVRSAVTAFGKKGWLRHALKVMRRSAFSQLDSEITGQLDLLLTFYNIARDAHIIDGIDRLQAREYAVEAEVQRQAAERKAMGEAVDEEALEKDPEVVRGVAVASGVSDAEFRSEVRELGAEVLEAVEKHDLKLDKLLELNLQQNLKQDQILEMVTNLSMGGGVVQSTDSSRLSLYAYDRKPDAPAGQKDKPAARLGRGSFGTTYRMRKVAGIDARRYAVKVIESEELDGAGVEKEAHLLSMIEHENALRFYDAFWHTIKARDDEEEDKLQFIIVTELLTGGSLVEKIAAAPPLQPPEVATLMQQIASGLAYMHSLNLQHRDLKPANVLLDSAGRAKIIDFGLACVFSASRRSRTKTKVGTDAYMSPEKAVGKRYGPADDVWAVGCILAELLLGRTIGNVALDVAKRQHAIVDGAIASERLGSWVEGCLQEIPGRRPAAAVLEQGLAPGGPGVQEAEERRARRKEEERARQQAVDRSGGGGSVGLGAAAAGLVHEAAAATERHARLRAAASGSSAPADVAGHHAMSLQAALPEQAGAEAHAPEVPPMSDKERQAYSGLFAFATAGRTTVTRPAAEPIFAKASTSTEDIDRIWRMCVEARSQRASAALPPDELTADEFRAALHVSAAKFAGLLPEGLPRRMPPGLLPAAAEPEEGVAPAGLPPPPDAARPAPAGIRLREEQHARQKEEGMRPEQSGGYGYNPQRAVAPRPTVQKTVTIRNEVNLKKPSLCATPHPDDPSKLLLEFKFDASADCQIGVYYLATEPAKADGAGAGAGYSPKDAGSTPPKEERRKGLGQSYKVPLSHPLDTGAYSEAELCWQPARAAPAGREDRYPIIICLEATSTQSGSAQSQTTFATLARIVGEGGSGGEAEWVVKPLKQKIQVGASSYELQVVDATGGSVSVVESNAGAMARARAAASKSSASCSGAGKPAAASSSRAPPVVGGTVRVREFCCEKPGSVRES